MPTTRPRARFEPISTDFDLKGLVESTPNFSYVDRISCEQIDRQGITAFDKLVLLHVVIGGKPLIIDGFEDRLDPWTFTPKWLRDNCGEKQENAWDLRSKDMLPLTIAHYLNNMGMLTNQFFANPEAYTERKRQRVYLKDIDCPAVWQDKLREHIPASLFYLNESTGEIGGPGAVPESNVPGKRLGKGIGRAGDLMSSLPVDMRAENLMCYIGHEGTYTPSHREMCASLGHNIMVEASTTVSDDGKPEKPGSSIWFMTESKDRHLVSEYWLSVLGHDIEVENHFAQIVAWKKAPFNVYVVEQRPGDFILIPPLAPHQVWNRGTRTMKIAWNRTTVETLEMALNEALPRSRIVCRDEQYKNKAMVYYTLQKYSGLLILAQAQAAQFPREDAHRLLYTGKIKQLGKDFRRLFNMYRHTLLSEMFNPDDRDTPKSLEYIPFDGNVTCAYCRGNIFNRFLTCPSCKDMLGHNTGDPEGDPYDICMDCYVMGRSCACISGLKWVEQFRWKELAAKYESWRKLIIALDGDQITEKTPLPLIDERRRRERRTEAEVCKEQLKRRPWKDVHKPAAKEDTDDEGEEIIVNDDGTIKKVQQKRSKNWLKNNSPCHVCKNAHPHWKMAQCTTCPRWWCYGTLFRGWDKMPMEIMSDPNWTCPHCLGICFAGVCKREGKMQPYEPKGTLLGHDTKKVADVRSVEALVDFSVSNLNWLRDDDPEDRTESRRLRRAGEEAEIAKSVDPSMQVDDDGDEVEGGDHQLVQSHIQKEASPSRQLLDPALGGYEADDLQDDDAELARRLQLANASLPSPAAMVAGAPAKGPQDEFPSPNQPSCGHQSSMYPQPGSSTGYAYPGVSNPSILYTGTTTNSNTGGGFHSAGKRRHPDGDTEDISMTKSSRAKKPRLTGAGFRSTDLASETTPAASLKAKNEAQRQFEREKERKALDRAKAEGRFIMLQAALKGKKRVVVMKVDGARLGQLMIQQAAKAALGVGDNHDAPHEIIDPELQEDGEEDSDDIVVLKSDIPPPKNYRQVYEQRQRDRVLINSTTKKALVPLAKDKTYWSSSIAKAPNGKRKPGRRRRGSDEFDEVDVGSDADSDDEGQASSPRRDRRSMPGYRRNRHGDDDDGDFPAELPSDYRDHTQRRAKSSAEQDTRPALSSPARIRTIIGQHLNGDTNGTNSNGSPEQNGAAQPSSAAPSTTSAKVKFAAVAAPLGGRPRGKPGKNSTLRPMIASPSSPLHVAAAQTEMDEQNRLAKLQALQMLDEGV